MDLELRHLKVVRAIADAGSLTRAATSLGLAQSALSGQLKRIERALGGALFVRDRNGTRPTQLGELLLDRSRIVLPAMRQLEEDVKRLAGGSAPCFRIGGTHGPLLGGLVDRLTAAHPQAPVSTVTAWSVAELAGQVADGRLDFALAGVCGHGTPPAAGRLEWQPLGHDPVFVMLADDHPQATEPELELGKLAGERWVAVPGDGCFADCFTAACAQDGFAPVSFFKTDTAACVHLVQVGRAVGLCRATMPPTPGVRCVPLAGTPLSWRHVIGFDPRSTAAERAGEVALHARAAYREAIARSPGYTRWLEDHPWFGPEH
ncbi:MULTISPECIES: LysR family transcriptional regulator [unclassified Streptomyces]|uniref:LysR substrate-binding domain-containing protein n=1 Tax=unclassified Streptomyces TaxID=2593676 RepID=UPI0022B6BC25|nr:MULTISPECIES: LysR family transcriptional regulator [unclassified Streptomyces]MCZ7415827.1 LysR family transcriptional regulator [Streptomyces sp. WMMC897]MCZ7434362.1 LysR family transcriptional regulator [Streptomyces sp. WMMC1477]